MNNKIGLKVILAVVALTSSIMAQSEDIERQLRRVNAKINREKVRTDSLEMQIRVLMPDLRNTLRATVDAKQQSDSVAILLINRINTLQNKIKLLEDKAAYIDSTNFEILAQLVMIENKIVTMTNSFTEMYSLKNERPTVTRQSSRISPAEYKKQYIESLTLYQNGKYDDAIKGFSALVVSDPSHELADNSQYWLSECYYSQKNYKRSVAEFEKVFTFPGTDKDDDAQLKIGLAYQSMGNLEKARSEFRRFIDYFPGSEYFEKAKEALRQLNIE